MLVRSWTYNNLWKNTTCLTYNGLEPESQLNMRFNVLQNSEYEDFGGGHTTLQTNYRLPSDQVTNLLFRDRKSFLFRLGRGPGLLGPIRWIAEGGQRLLLQFKKKSRKNNFEIHLIVRLSRTNSLVWKKKSHDPIWIKLNQSPVSVSVWRFLVDRLVGTIKSFDRRTIL